MRKFIIFSIIYLISYQLYSQTTFSGLYINKWNKNEFVCFRNDAAFFRVDITSGFLMYAIGKGAIEVNNKTSVGILKSNSLLYEGSTLKRRKIGADSVVIKAINSDNSPIPIARMTIGDSNSRYHIRMTTDNNGCGILDEELINILAGKELSIMIDYTIGVELFNIITIEKGYEYIIQSKFNYPFWINTNNLISFEKKGKNKVVIRFDKRKEVVLKKSVINCSCEEMLYNINE